MFKILVKLLRMLFKKRWRGSVMIEMSIFLAIVGLLALSAMKARSLLHRARVIETANMIRRISVSLERGDLESVEKVARKLSVLGLNIDSPPCPGQFEVDGDSLLLKVANENDAKAVLQELQMEWKGKNEVVVIPGVTREAESHFFD